MASRLVVFVVCLAITVAAWWASFAHWQEWPGALFFAGWASHVTVQALSDVVAARSMGGRS